jgi:uncharacterized SAM-binding protein YcdF (DUF218 family)
MMPSSMGMTRPVSPLHPPTSSRPGGKGTLLRLVEAVILLTLFYLCFGKTFLGLLHLNSDRWFYLLLVACLLLNLTRFRFFLWLIFGVTTLFYYGVVLSNLSSQLAQDLVRKEAPAYSDAIVVLNTSVTIDGYMNLEGLNRYTYALSLLQEGYAPLLVRTTLDPRAPSAEADIGRLANAMSIDSASIELVGPCGNTYDEAVAVSEHYIQNDWQQVLLITSPFQSTRSSKVFESLGMKVVCAPCPERTFIYTFSGTTHERWSLFWSAFYEHLAIWQYRRNGWILE